MENRKVALTENSKTEMAELGGRISGAIRRMMEASIIDDKILDLCLKEIALALFQTDVQFKLVRDLQINVNNRVKGDCSAATYDKQIVLQAMFDEVCKVLDPGKPSFSLVKDERRIVMFVGLQGSGKTTACIQFAHYYKKKGWNPAIVSADTFRATNFDQLMQNTMESNIRLYPSFMASDPVVKIACKGVEEFNRFDLIIIDTSERHAQESTLIEETRKISEATKPDVVIFVVRNGTGQAALLQRLKQSVEVGGVIVSGLNYDAKGGEALSSIAATKTPVLFFSRGERLEEFEVFNITHFVSHHLGLGEILGFMEDVAVDQQPEVLVREYPLRITYKLIYQAAELFPKLARFYSSRWMEAKNRSRRCYLTILDSMKDEELDGCIRNLLNCSFIMKISKQSKFDVEQVLRLMEEHKFRVHRLNTISMPSYETAVGYTLREYLDRLALVVENPKRVRAVRNECQQKLKKMRIQTR